MKLRARVKKGLKWALVACAGAYAAVVAMLCLMRFVDPPTTAVQMQRRVESWGQSGKYQKRYEPVGMKRISVHMQHAVVAAEDGRFYEHWGFDFGQIQEAIEDEQEGGRLRGASTITQQLVKNLFLTTRGGFLRKGIEAGIVPAAELILGKQRILELYLNVVEFGPGVFGVEAAGRYHYGTAAAALSREQSARLAAILPSPRRRKPARMNRYSAIIEQRMAQMGW